MAWRTGTMQSLALSKVVVSLERKPRWQLTLRFHIAIGQCYGNVWGANMADAGWFVDPAPDSPMRRFRYWDGSSWTDRTHLAVSSVRPDVVTAVPPTTSNGLPSLEQKSKPDAASDAHRNHEQAVAKNELALENMQAHISKLEAAAQRWFSDLEAPSDDAGLAAVSPVTRLMLHRCRSSGNSTRRVWLSSKKPENG